MNGARREAVIAYRRKGKAMTNHDNKIDEAGVPIIVAVNAKLGVLERRREYLAAKLARDGYEQTTSGNFDRMEVSAIDAAMRALRFHAATLRPELDPVVHLSRLVRQVRREFREGSLSPALDAVLREAEHALSEIA